jgi:uncharacterized membrane protein YoaT (DUF817 family)
MGEPGQISHSRFYGVRQRLEQAAVAPGCRGALFEFAVFVFKQGWACLFGALMLGALLLTHFLWPANSPIHRYDALTIYALAVQACMLALRLETAREASVIFIFHGVGTVMELFKTAAGSWIYPEQSFLHLGAVPLFSGFMYASVGSYIARIWRDFDFHFSNYPPRWTTIALAVAIYVNFFAHHWIVDLRWLLFVATALLFWRTRIWFKPLAIYRSMPLLVGFFLVAFFIWLGENIGTFAKAWTYPNQADGWQLVSPAKLGSWYLLMIISFVLVSLIARVRQPEFSSADTASAALPSPARQAS